MVGGSCVSHQKVASAVLGPLPGVPPLPHSEVKRGQIATRNEKSLNYGGV